MSNKQTCRSRGFIALLVTQFLGALNDNLYKIILSLFAVNEVLKAEGGVWGLIVLNVVFTVPYILFSPAAGMLADTFPKSLLIKVTKFLEVAIMLGGAYCVWSSNIFGLLIVLFFMGLQSTLFSPAKYGILPEILKESELSKANGQLNCWTFVAIIIGTALGGLVLEWSGDNKFLPGAWILGVALVGLISSLFVSKTSIVPGQKETNWNPLSIFKIVGQIKGQRELFIVIIALCFFWFLGAIFQLNILLFGKSTLGLGDIETALLVTSLGVGIGIGSIAAGILSVGQVELGLVPFGSVVIVIACLTLALVGVEYRGALACLFFLGAGAGFYTVPLNAYIQKMSPPKLRGRYIAASNFLTFVAILISSFLLLMLVDYLHFSPKEVFLVVGILTLCASIYACIKLPTFAIRAFTWVVVNLIYRLQVVGRDKIPEQSGALLVCNHVSFVDALLLMASIERPIRFMLYEPIYNIPVMKPFFKAAKVIPIGQVVRPRSLSRALNSAKAAIESGDLVCIFAEGGITRTGNMLPFSKGLEKIMSGVDSPIIPVCLDQVWGSIFSFYRGRFFWKRPKELPYPVTICYGDSLVSTAKTADVRQAIQELQSEAFGYRRFKTNTLHTRFIEVAKKNSRQTALVDTVGKRLKFKQALVLSLLCGKKLTDDVLPGEKVGVLLPPSVAGAVTNISLLFAGAVPVNLNYTLSREALAKTLSQCDMKHVVTEKMFLKKANIEWIVEDLNPLYVRGLLDSINKIQAIFLSIILPLLSVKMISALFVRRQVYDTADTESSLATIIFSSGSTGDPKGVMLTHRNILANLSALDDVFQVTRQDAVIGFLPFFHSFGFTGTIWLPLLAGMKAAYHPNPMDAKKIGELVQEEKGTILLATPTFLGRYLKVWDTSQVETLRLVVVGAEKLKTPLREAFMEKFGITLLEGYGATELAPVAAINVLHYESKIEQIGNKSGTVGHPLPGVGVRIVDPETFTPLPVNEEGLILVRGANVMKGYLNAPELTKEVMREGWYITGDIGSLDSQGFLTIRDRLSRFSKIGGEMVPHIRIEEELQGLFGSEEQVVAVTSVPDEKKGEVLVVILATEFDVNQLIAGLRETGLPNLWIPKTDMFFKIDELPLLGSGKLDLRELKKKAVELTELVSLRT